MKVAVVTDSTAYLPAEIAVGHGLHVVPMRIAIGGETRLEGRDVSAGEVAQALREFVPVSTSRPSPAVFTELYAELAEAGHDAIVSVHVSSQMSATLSSAQLAARDSRIPVTVVDSGTIGMAMGFGVIAAAEAAAVGDPAESVAETARRHTTASETVFYVDTLEHLRRGGRIGRASALMGSALAIKPLLTVRDGHIEPLERVRTTAKALSRLTELAAKTVEDLAARLDVDGVDVAVHHLDARERAETLTERLAERLTDARRVLLVELGAAVGAHVGPGTLAVAVTPRFSGRRRIVGSSV
ncbi:DegV family protein [Flexivirga sp. ID2601S]|uniref:DegV family protein n=1 Tax=Flexivirga aerilata TaxID=1656889 RepID=A0A849AGJ4_9MICO|nr:DegV family protein [Flexivirga aerilata]NNG39575.1 DegV family protein [Flexivirga aerilata]